MKIKRYLAAMLTALLLFTACACAPAEKTPPAQNPSQAQEQEKTQLSASGFALLQPIGAAELDAMRAEKKRFVVYFQGKKASETEDILQGKLRTLTEEYGELLLCDCYAIPLADYEGAKDLLGGNLFGLVLFDGDESIVLSGDSRNDVGSAFNRFFEYELVKPDDHGLPIVGYEEVMQMKESGEAFILYIGRDTCPQCRLFSPNLEEGVIKRGLQTPVYYFYVQSYYTAQEKNEEGADAKWEGDAASIGFQGTPSLLYFKDGEGASFDFFNNLFPEDANSQE